MTEINKACQIVKAGGIIAYPTEAVFGLGCDPFNETAVKHLADLKSRQLDKGFILIASTWRQIAPLTQSIPTARLQSVRKTWPGPFTWVFPASHLVPSWISGGHGTVALRITEHPLAKALCSALKGPLVSTSANPEGEPPARTAQAVSDYFPDEIDLIIPGKTGDLPNPTAIFSVLTGKQLR